eukprot:GHVU01185392.1.p1 GENE.GHVU01185392.1~~GHVU01185392.1.p1  ORF type:complete len:141 (-),score=3.16 GHVU01185392.1:556-915(-)
MKAEFIPQGDEFHPPSAPPPPHRGAVNRSRRYNTQRSTCLANEPMNGTAPVIGPQRVSRLSALCVSPRQSSGGGVKCSRASSPSSSSSSALPPSSSLLEPRLSSTSRHSPAFFTSLRDH